MDHARCLWRFLAVLSLAILVSVPYAFVPRNGLAGAVDESDAIPEAYEAVATDEELNETLKRCARGLIRCKPILADEVHKVPRFYHSWSVFLICNPAWLRDAKTSSVASLFDRFLAFGRALGRDHAAVWFVKKQQTARGGAATLDSLDIDRNVAYCNSLKLEREDSPHVIVTTTYPDIKRGIVDNVKASLSGMTPESIEALLTTLATQIGNEKLDQEAINSRAWWLKLKQALENTVASVGNVASRLRVTIKGGGIEATIEQANKPTQ
jgi:hypothetical protein